MVSTFTPNIQLEEPARGDYVGTWDTPVNANMTLLDLVSGGVVTISGAAGSVVLAAAQFQASTIIINSTLLASITLTFPTSFTKPYTIYNNCTGSSAFIITLQTTAAGANVLCAPPGEYAEVFNLGTSGLVYKNLGRVGSYWDYAGSSVPAWVSGCTLPPYLACTGGTFSSASYPQLATILGSTTLPDARGRVRVAVDGGAGRLSSAVAGFAPDTVGAGGGSQNYQQHTHTISITDPGHTHTLTNTNNIAGIAQSIGGANGFAGGSAAVRNINEVTATSNVTGITATSSNSGTGTAGNVQPTLVGGLVMIRAA